MSYEGAIPEWMGGWQGASPTSPHQGLGHPLCHQPPPPKLTKWPNISPQHHQVTKHISKWPKSPHHRHRSFFPTIRICPTPTPKLGPDHTIKNNAKKINGNTLTNFATAIFVWNENIEYFIHYFGLLFKAQPVICKWWIWFLFVISDNICHSVCVAFFLTASACLRCIYAFCNQWQGQAPLIIHLAPTSNICTWKPRSSALCNIFSHILHLNISSQIPILLEIHSSERPICI